MANCSRGVSQCILLTTNTLIFIIAAAGAGFTTYVFYDSAAKALTRMSLLTAVFVASLALMIFSCLGCRTASQAPRKKCSRCLYLSILLVLFIAEFAVAGYIFNLGHALDVAKDHHFDVKRGVNKAAEDALVFIHNQLSDLYVDEKCTGGAPNASYPNVPFNFTEVECKTDGATRAFHSLLQDNTIEDHVALLRYTNCTADENFKYDGSSSDFTKTFCGSEAHVVSLANRYAQYLVWFPVMLAALTFILLVATICMIADMTRRDRIRAQTLRGAQEPLQPVQIASRR